jgi:hypothetical protein
MFFETADVAHHAVAVVAKSHFPFLLDIWNVFENDDA